MGKNNLTKLSLEELSQELGRNPRVVSRLMERGELPVKVKGDKFSVSLEDLTTIREKLAADRQEMLDAFSNRVTIRSRAMDELSSEIGYDPSPKTDRIFL